MSINFELVRTELSNILATYDPRRDTSNPINSLSALGDYLATAKYDPSNLPQSIAYVVRNLRYHAEICRGLRDEFPTLSDATLIILSTLVVNPQFKYRGATMSTAFPPEFCDDYDFDADPTENDDNDVESSFSRPI